MGAGSGEEGQEVRAMGGGVIARAAGIGAALALTIACGGTDSAPKPSTADAARVVAAPVAGPVTELVAAPVAAPVDLSKLSANIPRATPDTFTFRPLRVERIPDAPPGLMEAAEREQGISRFCYQEYGQKIDPKLIGAVALDRAEEKIRRQLDKTVQAKRGRGAKDVA